MTLLEKLAACWPLERWGDVTVLVAVSGGADSVALARALEAIRGGDGRLVLAHYNHRLRGAESDLDQAFVERLAEQLGLRIVVGQAASDLAAGGSGEGIEGAARRARYEFLSSAAGQCGARYVSTAHTADDQVETVLHHVLRGTGLAGLAGISRFRELRDGVSLVRPLLDVTRAEVLDYLRGIDQPFRDDASNVAVDFTRNRIRLQLLPILERDYNPSVRDALLRLADIARQASDYLDQQAAVLLKASSQAYAAGVELRIAPLRAAHPAIVRQILLAVWQQQAWPLQDMSHAKWEQLRELIQADETAARRSAMANLPGGIRAERHGQILRLSKPASDHS
jgi:tRNA(Ile)-lysidine synthase